MHQSARRMLLGPVAAEQGAAEHPDRIYPLSGLRCTFAGSAKRQSSNLVPEVPFRRAGRDTGTRALDAGTTSPGDKPPDEQDDDCTDDSANEPGSLACLIPAYSLPEVSRHEGADNAQMAVRTNPCGSFVEPGTRNLATIPATSPIMIVQMIPIENPPFRFASILGLHVNTNSVLSAMVGNRPWGSSCRPLREGRPIVGRSVRREKGRSDE